MDSGYYAACTALAARTQALDTIANNLANVNTSGYRAEHNVFSAVLANTHNGNGSNLNNAINNYGIVSGASLDLSQGALQKTGNPLDLAIQGTAFFAVQTANGVMYTRNGSFQLSSTGQLITSSGDPVLGDKGTITMLPGASSISADGTISSNGAIAGKIRLVDFPAGTQLQSEGSSYYSAPEGVETPATDSKVQQGTLENSNVNPILSMVELITAQRSAESMQRALSMFSSEMDKTATQELPKIS
jgi:flagellar basal-body rod protein FlgF/flagellar basal-body rod protein FlgG